jgi:acyl transferase domain-containing protein
MHMEFIQHLAANGTRITPAVTTGNGMDFLIGRVSYTFGLTGPCLSTHTACSSSLVATHLAHTGLLNHEASAAAACGVFMVMYPGTMAGISQLQAFSPVGRCKTFDASGDGYGRGEGCAVAVLQRAGEGGGGAVAAVHSTVVNQAGRASSLTAPNGPAQTALIAAALAAIDLEPEAVRLVAVHGTGTPLGDPIETGALGQALSLKGAATGRAHAVTIASVKSCYGHTEGAAGLTGALLAVQALHHQARLGSARACCFFTNSSVRALICPGLLSAEPRPSSRCRRRPPSCTCATSTPT